MQPLVLLSLGLPELCPQSLFRSGTLSLTGPDMCLALKWQPRELSKCTHEKEDKPYWSDVPPHFCPFQKSLYDLQYNVLLSLHINPHKTFWS